MERRTAYLVEYAKKDGVFEPYGEHKTEYWSDKVLSKRLVKFGYYIESARFVIIEDANITIVEETD